MMPAFENHQRKRYCASVLACAAMIRRCTDNDLPAIGAIINAAAEAYRGVIPADCWHEPYMAHAELVSEIKAGIAFWGWQEADHLTGVMGLQAVADVTLIRHAYVCPAVQRRGIGRALLTTLAAQTPGPLLVGTWAAADWAIRFYCRHDFRLVSQAEKDRLLQTYWTVPPRQRECSVVLLRENVPWPRQRRQMAEANEQEDEYCPRSE
jgi:GNAT superfamily N-acetyltransferase